MSGGEAKPLTAFQQSYHWRNKNCGPWAQDWVKKTLPGKGASADGISAEISDVTSVSGDCDLGQRKGKLLTVYDIEIEAKWKGTAKNGDEVTGRLSIPEFSHEAIDGLSDYVFNWSVDGSGASADEVYQFVRKALPPVLKKTLNGFRSELLDAHGIFADSQPVSGAATPSERATQSYSPAPPGEVRKPSTPAPKADEKVTKTATVEVSAQMQASAADLWSILTDANRVPMWSRSAAKITPVPDTEFELFGGNVSGKIASVDAPTKLVQTWNTKSPGWPAGHYGTMIITLDQGSDSTALKFTLDGVPAGKEADIERALDAFYIRGLKSMGLVLSSSSRSLYKVASAPAGRKAKAKAGKRRSGKTAPQPGLLQRLSSPQAVAGTAAVGLVAVFVGLVASTFARPYPQASA